MQRKSSTRATILDVAARAQTSTATVSRVINGTGYVSNDLRERILAAARELGYTPNAVARSLKMRQTFTIGVIISDIANPFFAAVVRGIEDTLIRHRYHPLLCNTDRDPEKESLYIRLLREKRVDGLIISAASGQGAHLEVLREVGVPWVFLNRRPEDFGGPAILTDNLAGAYQGTALLVDRGHTRIAVVAGPQNVNTGADRLEGYREALRDRGIPERPEYIAFGDFRAEGGYDATRTLLSLPDRPTALFVQNNQMTIGALRAIREAGVQIPKDMALLAFDETEWASIVDPPLTTIAQPAYEMGKAAASTLLSAIRKSGPGTSRDVYLPPRLVVRASTG